ncbi:hypothetical protein GO491_02705 [Flavobacteriaceae bacterium Ap0902]|nr:hypothetical protein [Flavobacteriaceae bacterium Ap0902]
MLEKYFNRHKPRKFNYIPRYYDKENQDLIYNRIGDGRFASNYVHKKKAARNEQLAHEDRIDLTSYRVRSKRSTRNPQFNVFLILVGMLLIILIMWVVTNPEFTNMFLNE